MSKIYDINGNELSASVYKGKKISILGDSISTFKGWIPEGNAVYYTGSNCGMTSVEFTWWKRLINALEMELVVNNSWSGSRVAGNSASAGCNTRCTSLDVNGVDPDVIIVYLGINDFNNEVGLGSYDGKSMAPSATTANTFREAYAIMLNKMMNKYKRAEIWCCTLPSCEKNGEIGAPEINGNNVALLDFNDSIRYLANTFNAKIIELQSCGLTYHNQNIFMGDWSSGTSNGLHPNPSGHALMANHIIKTLDPSCTIRY